MGLLFWQASMLWHRKIKRALQKYDLTHTQFVILAVMEELSEQGKSITQKNISDFSMIDVMTVSSAIRLLAKKGLVSCVRHETDTRANSVRNTEHGRKLLQQATQAVDTVDKEFFFEESEKNIAMHSMLTELLQ